MKNFTNLLIFLGIISFVIMGCAKSDDSSASSAASSDASSDADDTVSASSGSSAITLSSKISLVSAKTTDSTARTAFATVVPTTSLLLQTIKLIKPKNLSMKSLRMHLKPST